MISIQTAGYSLGFLFLLARASPSGRSFCQVRYRPSLDACPGPFVGCAVRALPQLGCDIRITQHVALFVGHDGHALPADLQPPASWEIIGGFSMIWQNQSIKLRRSQRQSRSVTDEVLPPPPEQLPRARSHRASRCDLWWARNLPSCAHAISSRSRGRLTLSRFPLCEFWPLPQPLKP